MQIAPLVLLNGQILSKHHKLMEALNTTIMALGHTKRISFLQIR